MFRVIDHTADIGLLIEGKSTEELFTESAAGMFSIIVGGRLNNKLKTTKSLRAIAKQSHEIATSSAEKSGLLAMTSKIKIEEKTLEELLVSFLNELLYLAEKEKAIFAQFKINIEKIKNRFCLKGEIKKNSQIPKREIKATTHHNLKVLQKKRNLWQTRIIFDI